jgi:prepilin signal peptidase PulO-like enzyme (type II secretory pathway)
MTGYHLAGLAGFGFALGASVGSFLNVCIWRLPRRESLVRPGSRCPRCGSAIAARDNVPILGWLALRGRCRRCSGPISARYPLVEAAVGLLFAGVFLADLGPDPFERGPAGPLAALGYHLALSAMLVTVAMIARDERCEAGGRGQSGPAAAGAGPGAAALVISVSALAGVLASDLIGSALNALLLAVFLLRNPPPRSALDRVL